ncbi:MAG: NAD(P)-dependent oxidoreductase [Clostridiaceae bacterium]|nr:NAD(P)-dependent oxidoreductase [Clostridiaceae bacterium]
MADIGFIGLGNMGRGMCANLIKAGHKLYVYSKSEAEKQYFAETAEICESAAEVCLNSDFLFLSLPDSPVVEGIIQEFLETDIRGKIVIDTSTSNPISTRELNDKIAAAGGFMLDSPLLAGPEEARNGTLTAFAAGDEEIFEKVKPLLMSYCSECTYVGPIGNAHLIKLAQNFVGLGQALLYAQIYPVMEAYGIKASEMMQHFDNEVLSNWVFRFYSDKYVNKDYRKDFAMELGLKDLMYMKDLHDELKVPAFMLDGAVDLLRLSLKIEAEESPDFSYAAETMNKLCAGLYES